MTIHITPEQEFSYVSFETNFPQVSYKEIIIRVLETFQPGKFVLTFMSNKVGNREYELIYFLSRVSIFSVF